MKQNNTDKIQAVLNGIVEAFEGGTIPEAVALASFPIPNVPSSQWSFRNRILQFLAGTGDSRGYRQWQAVNRQVKRGATAIYILVPMIYKNTDEVDEEFVVRGFKPSPVFRMEDTQGEPLDYEQNELPELPLLERAEELGVSVRAVPGSTRYFGYYACDRREIGLASPEESVFLHELAHLAHEKVIGKLKPKEDSLQEIVAELSSAVLCRIVGKEPDKTIGNSYQYISHYASKLKITPVKACLKVLDEVELVLNFILHDYVSDVHSEGLRVA